MSQYDWGTMDPSATSGDQLAAALNAWKAAVHSQHSGAAEPTYKAAGLTWLDTTGNPWLVKTYDGADWIAWLSINTTTNKAFAIGSGNVLSFDIAGGTANALTISTVPPTTAYTDLDLMSFEAASNNTGAATINRDGVGAKALRKIVAGADVALAAGDILDGVRYMASYDKDANAGAGAAILINPSGAYATLTGVETLSNKTLTQPKIWDASSDNTFQIIGSELAANRTITLPALTANDEFVFKGWNIQALATWQAGTGTIESLVTPAKIKAAIQALVPPAQGTDFTEFLSSGTWNKPSWATAESIVMVEGVGAGGGSGTWTGNGGNPSSGGGGGAGGVAYFRAGDLTSSVTITIPAGGAANVAGGAATFGAYCSWNGGGKGSGNGTSGGAASGGGGGGIGVTGGNGASGSGSFADPGGTGGPGGGNGGLTPGVNAGVSGSDGGGGGGSSVGNVTGGVGGSSIRGGGGGGGRGAAGGSSAFAGAGGSNVAAAAVPGGGGAGGGNAGAAGRIRVTVFP